MTVDRREFLKAAAASAGLTAAGIGTEDDGDLAEQFALKDEQFKDEEEEKGRMER
jgi:hypothetical protein